MEVTEGGEAGESGNNEKAVGIDEPHMYIDNDELAGAYSVGKRPNAWGICARALARGPLP